MKQMKRRNRSQRKSERSFRSIGAIHPPPSKKMDVMKMKKIKKPSFRRIARRAGVKRAAGVMHNEFCKSLHNHMSKTLHDSTVLLEKRKTVSKADVVYALKNAGRVLYI